MGKKKFIEKKKSATFQLIARDSSDPSYTSDPSGDRIFVRVDNNNYNVETFFNGDCSQVDDSDSMYDYDGYGATSNGFPSSRQNAMPLPDDVRREILELGFPDDGYNYLLHMREIKNSGGGSAYYQNPKANFQQLPRDIKAYDATRVKVSVTEDDANESSAYNVASRTVGVRIQKAVDPEVAALLEDSDLSVFGSDDEDLEEDFVIKANLPENEEEVIEMSLAEELESNNRVSNLSESPEDLVDSGNGDEPINNHESSLDENPRVRRLLDEQFDLLQLQEYGSDGENEYDDFENEDEPLAEKLNHTLLKEHVKKGLDLFESYKVPADLLHKKDETLKDSETAADVIRKCMEYGKKYENEDEEEEVVFMEEESSDESEKWDCETIVSTYSNLDNHPGKISAPEGRRRKQLVSQVFNNAGSSHIISLGGKEKLPLEFLPHRIRKQEGETKTGMEKAKEKNNHPSMLLRKKHGQESKEEKKERKAAVKAEKGEARRVKKELKCLYKAEGHQAQRVAASSGPSSIHLM